jgi:hypothetical protein
MPCENFQETERLRNTTQLNQIAMKSNVKKSVFGGASSRFQAGRIVNHLANAGFSRENISILPSDPGDQSNVEADENYGAAGVGMLAGASETGRGWRRAWAGLPQPCFDHFTTGGPVNGAFRGAVIAPACVESAGPRESEVQGGHLLICLRTKAWREADAARKIFQAMGASNITLGGEQAFQFLAQTWHRTVSAN